MQFLVMLLVGAAVMMAARALLGRAYAQRLRLLRGLGQVEARADGAGSEEPLDRPLGERLLRPALGKLGRFLGRFLPRSMAADMATQLMRAGMSRSRPSDWLGAQAVAAVGLAGYGFLVLHTNPYAPLIAICVFPLGWSLPRVYLRSRSSKRKIAIRDDLPDAMDLLTVCVEAGLGFDQAMMRVVDRFPGPLGLEFSRVLRDQRLGTPRRTALLGATDRCDLPELSTFVHAILQAEELGVRIGGVLRVQSEALRERRRQRAEEQAMKAPIKMAFPMIFLILPALFMVVLGPAVVLALRSFQGGV